MACTRLNLCGLCEYNAMDSIIPTLIITIGLNVSYNCNMTSSSCGKLQE